MHSSTFWRVPALLAAIAFLASTHSVHAQTTSANQPSPTHRDASSAPAASHTDVTSNGWTSGVDVLRLNVDSIMRVLPAVTVTELLETRVPGLVVSHTSGEPGAASYLQFRGANSIAFSNAPVVIVDDIRLAETRESGGYGSLARMLPGGIGQTGSSPIDQIDPNTIDHIEILRGPAAAARYGSDGAHGVIVITTKRGATGAPTWNLVVRGGQSSLPGSYPAGYVRWGHAAGMPEPTLCAYHDTGCVLDSLPRFQALNDSRYTPFGNGSNAAGSLSLSGGLSRVTYALTGSATSENGIIHLPSLEAAYYESTHGFAPPSWMRDPESYDTWSGVATVGIELGRGATMRLTSRQFGGIQHTSSLAEEISLLEGAYIDPTTVAQSGFLADFSQQMTSRARSSTYGGTLDWPMLSWLPIHAAFGLDHHQRDDAIRVPPGYDLALDTIGELQSGTAAIQTQSANLGTVVPIHLGAGYVLPAAIGVAMTREWERIGQRTQTYPQDLGLSLQRWDAVPQTVVGFYLEPRVTLTSRIAATPGIRVDHDEISGAPSHTNAYPSLSVSWQALRTSHVDGLMPVIHAHAAYGEAGAQPGPDRQLQLLVSSGIGSVGAGFASALANMSAFTHPERSRELESGADLAWWEGRLTLDATFYNKQTRDALAGAVLNGVGGVVTLSTISADVRNRGIELGLTTQLVQRDALGWMVNANFSHNSNRVTHITGFNFMIGSSAPDDRQIAVGAPLFSRWTRPIAGYADQNSDGQIDTWEVVLQDSLVPVGSEIPPTVLGLNSAVTLFHGRLSLHTALEYDDGMTVLDYAATVPSLSGTSLLQGLASWPTAPFAQQAGAVVLPTTLAGAIQSVHVLRWSALAVNLAAPRSTTDRLHLPSATLTLLGNNLAMHSNYRGKDPTTTMLATGNVAADVGQVPMPRTWSVRVSLGQ